MKRKTIGFAACALLFLLAGCQDTVNTIENQEKHATPSFIQDKRYITDSFLRDRLRLISVNATDRTPDGHMKVQITARNVRVGFFSEAWSGLTGENPYKVAYKFTWLDENGMKVESINSAWLSTWVKPGETVFFTSVAPHIRCKDFIFNVKEQD